MKLKDFLTLKSGSGILLSGNVYNPYINYSWSQTLTVGGNQKIKDTGTSGLNLQQYFGRGCWFNGIDQNIVLETEAPVATSPIWTICFNINTASNNKYIVRSIGGGLKILWFNGGLTYFNGSANIKLDTTNSNRSGSYVVKSDGSNIYTYLNNVLISTISQAVEQLSFGVIRDLAGSTVSNMYLGILKDVYLFKKALSKSEIEKYNNQPNQFFMDSLEDSSCILAMPMCEKDKYVRNYKNYSEIPQTIAYTTLNGWVDNEDFTYSVNKDTGWWYLYRKTNLTNGLYYVSFEVTSITSGKVQFDNEIDNNVSATTPGLFNGIIEVKSNKLKFTTGGTGAIATVQNLEVKQLTAIYPITNYLATCRTNAQRLPYGLQTSGFKRDSNGLILSKSNFLECDGVGYCNTMWIPKWNEDFTVETVLEVSNDSEFRLNGNNYADGIYFGKNSVGKSLYVRVFGAPVILLANSKDIVCLIFSYNWQTKEVKQYVDGVLVTTQLATKTTNSPLPVLLGMVALGGTNYSIIKPIRLLKVHTKALTQEEITKNFNKYQSQGLLNE